MVIRRVLSDWADLDHEIGSCQLISNSALHYFAAMQIMQIMQIILVTTRIALCGHSGAENK